MLTKLLQRETCAVCRSCCQFSSYDIWSTPVLNEETRPKVQALLPDAQFLQKGENAWVFRVEHFDAEDNFTCPLLDPARGCMLGEEKPFSCSIWPIQIMEVEGRQVITLSPLCNAVLNLPFAEILQFVHSELAETIFAYAGTHPEEILPYDGVSPVLLWK
ncbi:MAG: hypothetical protein IKN55_03150 [Oscillospiraceae bacterium]|nr:hypothetical protein [Oscillospiraceae bacterium]